MLMFMSPPSARNSITRKATSSSCQTASMIFEGISALEGYPMHNDCSALAALNSAKSRLIIWAASRACWAVCAAVCVAGRRAGGG
jgi:hypothetical protein